MTRLFCLTLILALASHLPIQAQDKKDPPKNFTNSIGMKFVWIPPGTFMMGSPKEEKKRQSDETQHIRPFRPECRHVPALAPLRSRRAVPRKDHHSILWGSTSPLRELTCQPCL